MGPQEVHRTRKTAQLTLPVSSLAAVLLGGVRPSALAAAGAVTVLDPRALPAADRLFRTEEEPWCGTYI